MKLTYYGYSPYESECLEHHGIQGQHWGIRRYQNSDGTYTAEGKARRAKLTTNDAAKSLKNINKAYEYAQKYYGYSPLRKSIARRNYDYEIRNLGRGLSGLRYKENVIKKGTLLQRVSLNETEDKAAKLYVSLHGDRSATKYYNHDWAEVLQNISSQGGENKDVKVYRNTYKVKTDIIAPSRKDRERIMETLVKQDEKTAEELGKAFVKSDLTLLALRATGYDAKTYGMSDKDIKRVTTESYGKKYVDNYIKESKQLMENAKTIGGNSLSQKFYLSIPKSPKLMNSFTEALRKEGYNAVYDMNARPSSDAPFIIFDQNYIEQVGSKRIR